MSCHACTKKYSLFNKEKECPNCGYSYCGNCLKFKVVVPKLGVKEHSVCRSCHSALSRVHARSEQPEHPAVSLQRLESLDNPAKPPITLYQRDVKMQRLKSGLTQSETEIADRLEKLREGRRKERLPSVDEIANRLAVLKGENPSCVKPTISSDILIPDLRTEQQQIDDMMNQYREEQELALKIPSPVDDIANRLAQLRGVNSQTEASSTKSQIEPVDPDSVTPEEDSFGDMPLSDANKLLKLLKTDELSEIQSAAKKCIKEAKTQTKQKVSTEDTAEHDSGHEVKQVIEQVLAEAALEEKLAIAELTGEPSSESEELPWCIICNEDASLRCEDCDGDLYCKSCYMQGHANDDDMKSHKNTPFKPTNKNK